MRGFTLIELVVVVGIIGVLASIGIPAYKGYISGARDKNAQAAIRTIAAAQETYKLINGSYYSSVTTATCVPSSATTTSINLNLLKTSPLNNQYYNYCVVANTAVTPQTFVATALSISASPSRRYTINELGVTTVNGVTTNF